jgi:hypothetical protein
MKLHIAFADDGKQAVRAEDGASHMRHGIFSVGNEVLSLLGYGLFAI